MPTLKYKDPVSGAWVPLGLNGGVGPPGPAGPQEVIIQAADPGYAVASLDLWVDTDEVAPSASGTFLLDDDSVPYDSDNTPFPQGLSIMRVTQPNPPSTWPVTPSMIMTYVNNGYIMQMLYGQTNTYTVWVRRWVTATPGYWDNWAILGNCFVGPITSPPFSPVGATLQTGAMLYASDTNAFYVLQSGVWRKIGPWAFGNIRYASGTFADATAFTTVADVAGMTVTWTADPSRLYKITVCVQSDQITASGQQTIYITDASNTIINQAAYGVNATAPLQYAYFNVQHFESGLSGSITRKVRAAASAGSMRLRTSGARFIMVDDMGLA
jgi:hypothetical protein